jgi:hypothetical protein
MARIFFLCLFALGCQDDVAGGSDMGMRHSCGASDCKAGELCVPGCRGFCGCDPLPDGGTCATGPCSCGSGCELPPPASYCAPSLPSGCKYVNGVIQGRQDRNL